MKAPSQRIPLLPTSIVAISSSLASLTLMAAVSCKSSPPRRSPTAKIIQSSEFSIPFEKYVLDNGLTVILHEDHSDPIVAMVTVVHVGSSREKPGRTGFAHFFEHMSFNNSENVPMGANRKMIPELGGTRNGGTWSDGTIYYEVVPKDAFEKLLWIDSDRLGYMINTVEEGTLEREKQVVKNEKRQRVDNRPYGHTGSVTRRALYPADHPYHWTVIGELEDLQQATLADVREFYQRYYVPSNATLVIAGDINIAATKKKVNAWFGEIARGAPVSELAPMPVTLKKTIKLSHLDSFAKSAELRLTFPTVENRHPDSYALEALASVLTDGKNAPLYKHVTVEAKQSSGPWAQQSSNELAGTFTIGVRANPGVDLDDVYTSIEQALDQFESEGVRSQDLQRIVAIGTSNFYRSLEGVLGKARQLGIYEEFSGDPSDMFKERKLIEAVTREDVIRVYRRYIKDKPMIITSFVPKNQTELTLKNSTVATVNEEVIVAGAEKPFVENSSDDFIRTKTVQNRSEPPLGSPPKVRTPTLWRDRGSNGLEIVGIEHREIPMVSFQLRIDGGQQLDSREHLGTAALLAAMLNEGTATKTPLELEDAIDLIGSEISISAGRTSITIEGHSQTQHFQQTMTLVAEMLLSPRWDTTEFERLKTAQLAEIADRVANPAWVARQALNRQLYGSDHVAGQPFGGDQNSVQTIQLSDLRHFYQTSIGANLATLHVVGAVSKSEVSLATSRLQTEWNRREVVMPSMPVMSPQPQLSHPRVFFIDIKGSKQSVIQVGQLALEGADPLFYKLTVANNRLGGGSSARLMQTLRIAKGYSYGAGSRFTRTPYRGSFIASSQVRANVTLESLEIFKQLIGTYAETFTAKDLATTVNLLSKRDTRRFETLNQLRSVLQTMTRYDLADDYIAEQGKQLQAMTLAETRALIAKHIDANNMTYVIVGDAETQLKAVEQFGYGKPIMLDQNGARMTRD